LGVNFRELVHGWDVANEPDLIGIQEHDFAALRVGLEQRRLVGKVAVVSYAWSKFCR
jgi:hypothetical protein